MQLQLKRPLVFFDTETTGTNPKEDFIISIAIIKVFPSGERESKSALIKPPIPIPASATEVHGITDEMVKDAPAFKQLAKGILWFIEGTDLAGFNSNSFDIPLLYNEFKRAGITWNWKQSNFIDVCNIFKIKEARTLTAAVKFYCDEDHSEAHDALADVEATINVFSKQLEAYTDLPQDIEALSLFSNFDRQIVDLTGTFRLDSEGDYVFNFGKCKDKKAKEEISYLQWIVDKSTFEDEVKEICRGLLTQHFKHKNYLKGKT